MFTSTVPSFGSYDHRNWECPFHEPVVQSLIPTQPRYYFPYEYALDPVAQKAAHLWNSRNQTHNPVVQLWQPPQQRGPYESSTDSEVEYSSRKKADYPIVPYNAQPFYHAPAMGSFDFQRKNQTDVLDLIYSQRPPLHQFQVSLANTISPLLNKMGTMKDLITKENLGTCTLIAHNLVLVARHAIEGCSIQNITITFGHTRFKGIYYSTGQTNANCVIEEDAYCDYAIIQLEQSLGESLGFAPLNIDGRMHSEPALLHYPLGKPLKVSVHAINQTQYQAEFVLTDHDSDYFSSGGAYFDPMGRMSAMHLGAQLREETMNLRRYALPFNTIIERNPHSLLGKFARGELSQAASYTIDTRLTYLAPTNHAYLMDEEGRESEKILRKLLPKGWEKNTSIKQNKNGTIYFSKRNLEYLASNYPREYENFKKNCVGITGKHQFTRLYSADGVIESDHTIPYDVWNSTTHPQMASITSGSGKRPGEDDMPAMTIPYEIHRRLLTTGSSTEAQNFRESLTGLCNAGKVDQALILCYQEYENRGLDLQHYKGSIVSSLDNHVGLRLITDTQKAAILRRFSLT